MRAGFGNGCGIKHRKVVQYRIQTPKQKVLRNPGVGLGADWRTRSRRLAEKGRFSCSANVRFIHNEKSIVCQSFDVTRNDLSKTDCSGSGLWDVMAQLGTLEQTGVLTALSKCDKITCSNYQIF